MISIVLPVLNEEKIIKTLLERLKTASTNWGEYELIFVDDGSTDRTLELIKKAQEFDGRIKILSFSRNFGHQQAVTAGLKASKGEAVAIIDADLQDPPEMIEEFLKKRGEGYEIVYAIRRSRKESVLKRFFYKIYYRLLSGVSDIKIPLDAGDFSLLDRKVVDIINSLPEHQKFLRGLRSWTGFCSIGIPYDRDERKSGNSKYTVSKLFKLAFDGITSFSTLPLKISIYAGFIFSFLSFILGLCFVILRITVGVEVPGWTSLILAVFFMGGIQLFILGVIGEYIGRIFIEVQDRPSFIIKEKIGF